MLSLECEHIGIDSKTRETDDMAQPEDYIFSTKTDHVGNCLFITDAIYNSVEITEPVLVDLILSDAMQRLRQVFQYGVTALLDNTPRVTRFDHSLGAMILIRRLGGSLDEQIAALLHDVSHTALSHVADEVFPEEGSFHESNKIAYVLTTDIPEILRRYGIPFKVMDEEEYPLLEQPPPFLCADRLDYAMRDALAYGFLTSKEVQTIADAMVAYPSASDPHRVIACTDSALARLLADAYVEADRIHYNGPLNGVLYLLAARSIRYAIENGIIDRKDMWMTDLLFWEKLSLSSDHTLRALLSQVRLYNVRVCNNHIDHKNADAVQYRSRLAKRLDPHVVTPEDKLARLSDVDAKYAAIIKPVKSFTAESKIVCVHLDEIC